MIWWYVTAMIVTFGIVLIKRQKLREAGPTRVCQECKSDIPSAASRCKHCGTKFTYPPGLSPIERWIMGIVSILFTILFVNWSIELIKCDMFGC